MTELLIKPYNKRKNKQVRVRNHTFRYCSQIPGVCLGWLLAPACIVSENPQAVVMFLWRADQFLMTLWDFWLWSWCSYNKLRSRSSQFCWYKRQKPPESFLIDRFMPMIFQPLWPDCLDFQLRVKTHTLRMLIMPQNLITPLIPVEPPLAKTGSLTCRGCTDRHRWFRSRMSVCKQRIRFALIAEPDNQFNFCEGVGVSCCHALKKKIRSTSQRDLLDEECGESEMIAAIISSWQLIVAAWKRARVLVCVLVCARACNR